MVVCTIEHLFVGKNRKFCAISHFKLYYDSCDFDDLSEANA
jgi:hypothetical protein